METRLKIGGRYITIVAEHKSAFVCHNQYGYEVVQGLESLLSQR